MEESCLGGGGYMVSNAICKLLITYREEKLSIPSSWRNLLDKKSSLVNIIMEHILGTFWCDPWERFSTAWVAFPPKYIHWISPRRKNQLYPNSTSFHISEFYNMPQTNWPRLFKIVKVKKEFFGLKENKEKWQLNGICGLWLDPGPRKVIKYSYRLHGCMLSCFSCVRLFVTPWTVALQAPLSMGFSRQEYWSGLPLPSPGNLPDPGIEPGWLSHIAGRFFNIWATREAWGSPCVYIYLSFSGFHSHLGPCRALSRRRQWHPTPVLLPGKSYGWRSLVGCSPWGHWGSDTTEPLHFHFSLSCIGEGKWQPTPVFLPGESQGLGSLVGCHLWGCTESDTTEVT